MRLTHGKHLLIGLGAATLFAAAPLSWAAAATTSTTFTVTANVTTNCTITATNINFGTYAGTAIVTQTGTLTSTCSTGTPYDLGLNAGTSTGATVSTRAMTGPATDLLHYTLSQDAGHSINWGNTVGTDTVHSTGTGAAQTFTVFGQIAAGQFVSPGAYQDTITVTLTF